LWGRFQDLGGYKTEVAELQVVDLCHRW
jgi:hypothetical protein